tara:strand:- start:255 stop:788 length:534 start_codon:yes stop_codon:yes gene_type:complete
MSNNRLYYDTCEVKTQLKEALRPGEYQVGTPVIEKCYPSDPSIRLQRTGNSVSSTHALVDVHSELWGITRKNSRCPSDKYNPCEGDKVVYGKECVSEGLKHTPDCNNWVENTRLSNPSCNLRGTGWNRWEWLCTDPQERVFRPYDWNIQSRTVVKDNHRPCIPKLIDQTPTLPNGNM